MGFLNQFQPRAASGVQYFSAPNNINPGLSSPMADAEAPGAGMAAVQPEEFGAPTGDPLGVEAGQAGNLSDAGKGLSTVSTIAGLGAAAGRSQGLAGLSSLAGNLGFGVNLVNNLSQGNAGQAVLDILGKAVPLVGLGQAIYGLATGEGKNAPPVTDPNDPGFVGPPTDGDALGRSFAQDFSGYAAPSADTSAPSSDTSVGGGEFARGGLVGLTRKYMDGGPVSGGPLLAMGFAAGGAIPPGAGGAGMGMPSGDMSPQMVEMRVNEMLGNPQVKQRIMQGAQRLMQSGELTPQEVQTMGQVAEASMQNPDLYPRLRTFVAQQGMSPLPPAYDPSVIIRIIAVSRALAQTPPGATPPGQVPPTDQAQMQNPTGAPAGGFLTGPGTGTSDSIGTKNMSTGGPVAVSNGEYVIPKRVVDAKGREFFDNLLRRYADIGGESRQGA